MPPNRRRLPGSRGTRFGSAYSDAASGEVILSGLGDAHLEVTIERLKRKFNVDVELALPRVPYRETVSKKGAADFTHRKQTGGHGQYARVLLEVSPLPRGSGLLWPTTRDR